jgi:hypothetical protein
MHQTSTIHELQTLKVTTRRARSLQLTSADMGRQGLEQIVVTNDSTAIFIKLLELGSKLCAATSK